MDHEQEYTQYYPEFRQNAIRFKEEVFQLLQNAGFSHAKVRCVFDDIFPVTNIHFGDTLRTVRADLFHYTPGLISVFAVEVMARNRMKFYGKSLTNSYRAVYCEEIEVIEKMSDLKRIDIFIGIVVRTAINYFPSRVHVTIRNQNIVVKVLFGNDPFEKAD